MDRERVVGVAVAMLIVGAIGGTVAMRIVKKGGRGQGHRRRSRSNSRRPTLPRVEAKPLSRWLPVSGAVQPVRQATVKAKVSGDVRQITVREGETVQAGQVLARIDTADLDAKLIERIGALEGAKAQLALAEKNRATNTALLEAELHLAERVRQFRVELERCAGQREVGRGAGADRAQRAARRRSPCRR